MTMNKNDEFGASRSNHVKNFKRNKRKNVIILILILLIIFLSGSLYYFKYLKIDTEKNSKEISENSSLNSETVESTLSSDQNIATKELENNYTDEDIEFARVVANVDQNKHIYTLENIKDNKISIYGKEQGDGKLITIMENGQDNIQTNQYIYYIPLGEGYIEHTGIRRSPSSYDESLPKIYLETKYDDIALELLKNSSNLSVTQGLDGNNTSVDLKALLNGDFSSIAGTWKNEGAVLTINDDGSTTDGQKIKINSEQNTGEMITGGIGFEGQPGGAGISILDVGVLFPNIVDNSDKTRVRIIIAQQVGDFPAGAYFYKVQE